MTAEQLEELLADLTHRSKFRRDSAHDDLSYLAPSLARRVIAAEKLVDDAERVMHELLVTDSWSSYEVNKLLSEITAYREASKGATPQ